MRCSASGTPTATSHGRSRSCSRCPPARSPARTRLRGRREACTTSCTRRWWSPTTWLSWVRSTSRTRVRRTRRTCSRSPMRSLRTAWARTSTRCAAAIRPRLFPLDRRRRLRRDVEHDPVHGRDLVDDPRRDRLQQVIWQPRPVGRHRVVARHRAHHDWVAVRALVALDADRADRRQHRERLPQLAVEPRAADLLLEDRVGLAQDLEPLARHLADDPDRQPWPRERLPPDHPFREAELLADAPHLVLEEQSQRLDELHLHLVG